MMRRNGRITKTITKAVAIALSFSIIFGSTIGSYANELETIESLLTEAETEIGTAEGTEVDFSEIVVDNTAQVEENLSSFDVSANIVDSQSDEAIGNANVANTTDVEAEAIAAKENAEAELANAEKALEKTNESYDNAYNNYNDVSANYAVANNEYNTAVEALADVSANTVAAEQALAAAKALIDSEGIKRDKLETMEDQYYGLMVYYYRKNNAAVYDVSGNLDIDASAEKMTAEKQDYFALHADDTFFKYGRLLTKEMIEYMIICRDDVSADNTENQYSFGLTGGNNTVYGQDVVVYKNNKGQDQTKSGEINESYRWTRTGKDGGRGNYVEVSYVDVSGEAHTEYYNYVLKNSTEENNDLTTGPIYLALIEIGDNNNNTPVEVVDSNNYSNYQELVTAVTAYQALDTYTEAYEKALAKVEALQATYAELSASATATKAQLDTLKAALETATENLAAAEEKKEAVTAKYEEAKKAVEGIDLSRFAVVPVTVVTTEETPAEEPTEEPTVIILPDETPLVAVPVFAAPEGEEEEAEEVTAVVAIDEDAAPLADGPAVTEEPEEAIAAPVVATITTDINGDNVPLAGLAFADSVKKVWWLWLLILLTVVTMYIIYKKNTKKEENK